MAMQDDNTPQKRELQWLLNEKYHGISSPEYLSDVERLQNGYPLDYIIGSREFLGCHIDLSLRPLIPRNETEYWMHQVITNVMASFIQTPTIHPVPYDVLDMCSGSGCLGISCINHLLPVIPQLHVDCAEYNNTFVQQIHVNVGLNNIDSQYIDVYQSDMFSALPSGKQYDIIVANPPYIATDRVNTVQTSVHAHEDHNSLYAPDGGLQYVKIMIDCASDRLKPGGHMYIEYDSWQTEHIIAYLQHYEEIHYSILQDQYEKNRVVVLNMKQ